MINSSLTPLYYHYWSDPLGLYTLSFSLSAQSSTGFLTGQSRSIAIVFDSRGSTDFQITKGEGYLFGLAAGLSLNIHISNADSVNSLLGESAEITSIIEMFEAGVFGSDEYEGLLVGLGLGGSLLPFSSTAFKTETSSLLGECKKYFNWNEIRFPFDRLY